MKRDILQVINIASVYMHIISQKLMQMKEFQSAPEGSHSAPLDRSGNPIVNPDLTWGSQGQIIMTRDIQNDA